MARQTITINLIVSELLYDIENKTYLTARSRNDGANHELVSAMQADADPENRNQILRSIGTAYDSIIPALGEYVESYDTSANNVLMNGSGTLSITLSMPDNFNLSETAAIGSNLHQFIVSSVLAEWFTITDKADAESYGNMAASNIALVKAALNRRSRPVRTIIINA